MDKSTGSAYTKKGSAYEGTPPPLRYRFKRWYGRKVPGTPLSLLKADPQDQAGAVQGAKQTPS